MRNRGITTILIGLALTVSLIGCETQRKAPSTSSSSKKEAQSRLGYVRSKDKSADFKKFDYQFSMDMDTTMSFKPVDRANFNQCKINAAERIPTVRLLDPCTEVIDSDDFPQKMKTASLYNRGLIKQNLDRQNEARVDFEAVLANDNDFGDADLAIASLDLVEQNYANAQIRIKSALEKTVRHPAYAHYLLGHVLEKQSKFIEARVQYRRALELRPNWRDVQRRIDRIGISWPESSG